MKSGWKSCHLTKNGWPSTSSELITEGVSGSEYARPNDWEPTLLKRGFVTMVDDFLGAVGQGSTPYIDLEDALLTHTLCEEIISSVSEGDY